MNLAEISPEVIVARGKYATINAEYKSAMSLMQQLTQTACDNLRHALQKDSDRTSSLESADLILERLCELNAKVAILKAQKDELWNEAWGKK